MRATHRQEVQRDKRLSETGGCLEITGGLSKLSENAGGQIPEAVIDRRLSKTGDCQKQETAGDRRLSGTEDCQRQRHEAVRDRRLSAH
jgi:hypothetical protein